MAGKTIPWLQPLMYHYQTKLKIGVVTSLMDGLDVLEEHTRITRMPVGFCMLVRAHYCEMRELGSLPSSLWISKRHVRKAEKKL